MPSLQLELQPQTARRLKTIFELYPDQESFAQSMIAYQIAELKQSILHIRLDLKKYEEKYQRATEEFYQAFTQGNTDDREDYIIWAGLYEMLCDNKERLRKIQ